MNRGGSMHSRPIHAVFVLSLVLALPAFALQPNLVKGGSFDTFDDIRNWRGIGLDWEGIDAQSRPDSGSGTLSNRASGVSQCIAITPNREYDFGARVLLTRTGGLGPNAPRAYVKLEFWPAVGCDRGAAPLASAVTSQAITSPNGRFTALSARLYAPADAGNAKVTLLAVDPQSGKPNPAPALFDDVFLQERGGCVPDDATL